MKDYQQDGKLMSRHGWTKNSIAGSYSKLTRSTGFNTIIEIEINHNKNEYRKYRLSTERKYSLAGTYTFDNRCITINLKIKKNK